MTTAKLIECDSCGLLEFKISDKAGTVPGTGAALHCDHKRTDIGTVEVPQLVHVALSTLLRAGVLDNGGRATAHQVQEWLRVPARNWRVGNLPWVLQDGYGVSSYGLATARILAASMAALTVPSEAFYWLAASSLTRRKLAS